MIWGTAPVASADPALRKRFLLADTSLHLEALEERPVHNTLMAEPGGKPPGSLVRRRRFFEGRQGCRLLLMVVSAGREFAEAQPLAEAAECGLVRPDLGRSSGANPTDTMLIKLREGGSLFALVADAP